MEKNPFSLYDFMGYLFPGCLSLIILAYFHILNYDIYKIVDVSNWVELIPLCNKLEWESSLVIIVVGYILGHIIAYWSSLIIEIIYTNKIFGYPSSYLLNNNSRSFCRIIKDYFESPQMFNCTGWNILSVCIRFLIKLSVLIIIFPISIILFLIGWISGLNKFIVRPLDGYLQSTLKDKQFRLAEKLKITHPDVNEDCDYHRIVMHYVYINIPRSQTKTNNYLALYGFLRSLTLITCISFDIVAYMSIKTIACSAPVSWDILCFIIILFTLTCFLYLAFVKFYRRFTLENLMSLLVGMPEDVDNSAKNSV